MKYLPQLDGLRGIAVGLVMLHHFVPRTAGIAFQAANSMWVGVDLFFVLSGFLITGILYDAKGSAAYFSTFYARRTLRIFPLYYGVLVVAVFFASSTGRLPWLLHEQGWLWTYTSNIRLSWANGWILNGDGVELNHLWSLAVEEHFYLIWPLIIYRLSQRGILILCGVIMLLSPVLRTIFTVIGHPIAAYVFTLCRIDALALGGSIALLMRSSSARARMLQAAPWIALCAWALVFGHWFRSGWLSHGQRLVATIGLTLLPLAWGGVLVTSLGDNWLRRGLENRWLRLLGRYSYGIYVFHMLIRSAVPFKTWVERTGFGWVLYVLAGCSSSILAAIISFHIYEQPFLQLKRFFSYRSPENHDLVPAAQL